MSYRQLYMQSPYGDLHLEALDVGLSEDLPITTKTEPSPTETARWRWVSHRCSGTPLDVFCPVVGLSNRRQDWPSAKFATERT